jgi:hypothetical protein
MNWAMGCGRCFVGVGGGVPWLLPASECMEVAIAGNIEYSRCSIFPSKAHAEVWIKGVFLFSFDYQGTRASRCSFTLVFWAIRHVMSTANSPASTS